jgi:spore coat polysaccharide biosynthesis protein SpsF
MKTAAIIQARMSSTRLPGKVLLPLGDKTVLGQVIQRVKSCRRLDQVIIATTEAEEDDAIVRECERLDTAWFRGSLTDVLGRYHGAASAHAVDVVVRITSDCPLFDPILLDKMLEKFHALHQSGPRVDYLSNTLRRLYPRGLDAEIFTFAALRQSHEQAAADFEREHVTLYIYRHPELFRLFSFAAAEDHSDQRWTLDTPEDYQLLQAIFQELGRADGVFSTEDVLDYLKKNPRVAKLNAHIEQKQAC